TSHHRGCRGLPRRAERLPRTCRPELLGAFMTATGTTSATTTTAPKDAAPTAGSRFTGAVANYIDERTSISGLVKELGRKIFPDHWSFMLGEVAIYSFIAILLSGTFLTLFFDPSMVEVHYEGSYDALKGI